VALGEEIAGLFVNNQELKNKLLASAETAGEKLWELPLEKEYKDTIKSDVADLRNISKSRYGGAITAALFLEEFVSDFPWAHIDIAGPAFEEKDTPIVPKGGAGFGVRTLLNLLKNL
jgi:leucyl aminopeptidase